MWRIARQLTLRQRLVALVAVALIPAAAALAYFIAAFHQDREREVHDHALQTSEIAALEMERIVTGAESVLETLGVAPSVRYLTAGCDAYLAEVSARLPQFSGFAVADSTGRVPCSAGLALLTDGVGDASWFRAALRDDGFVVGEYTGTRPDAAPYLPVALSLGEGKAAKVMMTGIDLAWLGARMRERNLAQGSALAIADRNGILIAREPDAERFVGNRLSEAVLPLVSASEPGTAEITSADGTRRIIGYQPPAATGIGLYVGAGFSTDEAFAPVYASTRRSVALAAAGAVAAVLLASLVGERLFRQPIRRILATIASWRAGDESARTGIPRDAGELSALAASIDEYMESLAAVRAEREAAEQHRTLLLREMNHRIKNILAAVQAIANQTFKDRASPESISTFGSRLSAMAAAHDLLVSENWSTADLHQTLTAALNPFGLDRQRRFVLDGPPLQITAKAALALSMALHELCTNAAKYGALGVPGGQVTIQWRLVRRNDADRFQMSWTERGGPPVAEPEYKGFGSRLIQAALASELAATADLDFRRSGLRFTLDADAPLVVAEQRAAPAKGTAA